MNTVVRLMLYMFVHFFKMVRRVEEHRAAVIALYRIGKKSGEIFKTLQDLDISHMFIYQTLARYREIGSTKDQPHGGHYVIFINKNKFMLCVNVFEEIHYHEPYSQR